jgi:hypothetical protein
MKNKLNNKSGLKGLFQLLGDTWRIFTKRYPTFFRIIMLPIAFLIAVAAIVLILKLTLNINPYNIVLVLILDLLAVILFVLFFWSQLALIYAIANNKSSAKEAYISSRKMLWAYFVLSFLTGLIVFGGFVLLIIPGILFYIWLILATFVFVAEGDKEVNALLKSYEYVKGYFWQVSLRVLFITLIFGIIGEILTSIFKGLHFNEGDGIVNIATFLFYPLTFVYYFEMYKNLKSLGKQLKPKESKLMKNLFITTAVLASLLIVAAIVYLMIHPEVMNIIKNILVEK